jgi:transcriptional regulator with XRE-family HTH domain
MILSAEARREFGATLKRSRLARGLSQAELASTCAVNQSSISLYERGHVAPARLTLEELSHSLGLSPTCLLKADQQGKKLI